MAKTAEQYTQFIKALFELCDKHEIGIQPVCETEGILGELLLYDPLDLKSTRWDIPTEPFLTEISDHGIVYLSRR
jgi:hypothetical protein